MSLWLLVLLLACGALPAQAGPMAVRMPNGACSFLDIPAATLEAWQKRLDAEQARLEAMAGRLLAEAAAMRLAAAREAVPAFGDWAYDWVESYLTAWRVLGLAAKGLAEGVAAADTEALADRLARNMAGPVRDAFRSRVLEPAIPPAALLADRAHAASLVAHGWQGALRGLALEAAALPRLTPIAPAAVALPRLDLNGAARLELEATEDADPLALVVEEGADTNTVFLRSMRPMAARLGALVLRVSEAGSIVATGGAFGYALGGTPGVALGMAGGVGVSWGLDWVLNRVDSALNRPAFEAQALEAIDRAEARLAAQGQAAVAAALAARRAALLGASGCG
ncbi:hypothetical protein [Falsiroseomonas selenitidurans]|uniref:Uncharacterized protein n=1 Tax=Falsiroseomonas selenitidurans TaxID=2716335 RepID=A0ABX1E9V6_9PROT|nr:hypothetical protein [Falsiroseomonas selenitidurans]NKC32287.1 hypothetical protein [Falsiroseomonas selenitidurans]